MPTPIRIGYRSFDRQWVIPDVRVLDMPRTDLWHARLPDQLFLIEQHAKRIDSGPGVVVSALIPELHHFDGDGGRTLPALHPDGTYNVSPSLVAALTTIVGTRISAEDVVAYTVAVASHPAFGSRFADELRTPGIQIPFSRDADDWREAVDIGKEVIWIQTYGERYADEDACRPSGSVRLGASDTARILATAPVKGMPDDMIYDEETLTLHVGTGAWSPVSPEVMEYHVGSRKVVASWFNYRRAHPTGKVTSPLDTITATEWSAEWTSELSDLLSALHRLVVMGREQDHLLARVLASGPLTLSEFVEAGFEPPAAGERAARMADTDSPTLDITLD